MATPPSHKRPAAQKNNFLSRFFACCLKAQLGADLSTGLFLDQRLQRNWLRTHLGPGDKLLNCFAHAGGYSVAAGVAGASSVSLDLSKYWLDRIDESLKLNGLGQQERKAHDTIYGDCFDWLKRLAKRVQPSACDGGFEGQFDVVILDPPTTSTGTAKKRWSAAKDYPELVALAAPLVAPGGALWCTTNHRGTSPHAFADLVKRGLEAAPRLPGLLGAGPNAKGGANEGRAMKPPSRLGGGEDQAGGTVVRSIVDGSRWALERSCPPALDYPCGDSPPGVKTLVWRRL